MVSPGPFQRRTYTMDINAIQTELRRANLDGWLFMTIIIATPLPTAY